MALSVEGIEDISAPAHEGFVTAATDTGKSKRQGVSKFIIDNRTDDPDVDVIKAKLNLLLASVLSSLTAVHVTLRIRDSLVNQGINYRCEVEGVHQNSKRFIVSSEHPSAITALEGAAQRLRRSVVRSRQFV